LLLPEKQTTEAPGEGKNVVALLTSQTKSNESKPTPLVEKYGTYTTVYGTKCGVVYGADLR
jgi:hypothetical protein